MITITNILIKMNFGQNKVTNDQKIYVGLLTDIAKIINCTVIKKTFHKFKPTGLTGVLLLSESHISVHTWPEEEYAVIDLISCKPVSQNEQNLIKQKIQKTLNPLNMEILVN